MKTFSLKKKLLTIILGILGSLGLFTWLLVNALINSQKSAQQEALEAFAGMTGDHLSALFFERYGDVQAFATNSSVRTFNKRALTRDLNEYTSLYGVYDLILVIDLKGNLIGVNDRDASGNKIDVAKLYQMNFSGAPYFKSVIEGKFTEDSKKGIVGTYVENFQVDSLTSGVYGSPRLGNGFSAPIKDENGKIIGVLSNRASYRWIEAAFKAGQQALIDAKLKDTHFTFLSKDGDLFFDYPLEEKNFESLVKRNLVKENDGIAAVALHENTGTGSDINSKGIRTLESYAHLDDDKFVSSLGWFIMLEDTENDLFAEAFTLRKIFYTTFFVVFLIVTVLGVIFAERLSKHLMTLARTLRDGSEAVLNESLSISASSNELSESSVSQASAIQQTASAIDEVTSMVKKNSENAQLSKVRSEDSLQSVKNGHQAVQRMVNSIQAISDGNTEVMQKVEEGNRRISEITNLISEIGNKTKVINDIVFQTKLLSFNASVKAARAGEHGKGFAVVAEEVGSLAQMSGNAAKEISDMLESSIARVESIVTETRTSVEHLMMLGREKVEQGKSTATECGRALEEISKTVSEVDSMVSEISSASDEQAQGVEEISKAMNQLDQAVQKNSSSAQNSAVIAVGLKDQSTLLKEAVDQLQVLVTGKDTSEQSGKMAQVIPIDIKMTV